MHSRADVISIIFKTLDFERSHRHTVETLMRELRLLGVVQRLEAVRTYPFPSIVKHTWTENDIRVVLAELIQVGRLERRNNGELVAVEFADKEIEHFQGAWYVTVNGSVKGPFTTEGEAVSAVNANRLQTAGKQ